MDIRAEKHMEIRVVGTADPIRLQGQLEHLWPRVNMALRSLKKGSITIRIDDEPIRHEVAHPESIQLENVTTIPGKRDGDSWESYYDFILPLCEDEPMIATFYANEVFGESRNRPAWSGDDRAARFIHMNASHRLYARADPTEYAALATYVRVTYPELYGSLSLKA